MASASQISVLAYLLGSVSQGFTDRLTGWTLNRLARPLSVGGIESSFSRIARISRAWENGRQAIDDQVGVAGNEGRYVGDAKERATQELEHRANEAVQEALIELTLPATLLVGDKPELFAEVDRLRSEGDLRVAVTPPLAAITLGLAILQSPWWTVGIGLLIVLASQGIGKVDESRKVIADAISQGKVPSSSQDGFDGWVQGFITGRLPRLIAEVDQFRITSAVWASDSASADVTARVAELIGSGGSFTADPGTLGNDPEYGQPKRLTVEWRWREAKTGRRRLPKTN